MLLTSSYVLNQVKYEWYVKYNILKAVIMYLLYLILVSAIVNYISLGNKFNKLNVNCIDITIFIVNKV